MLAAPAPSTLWISSAGPTALGDYAMLWAPGAQMISDGSQAFTHNGAINTEPSHDLAHLIVAASGLPWKPAGPQSDICFAEYNAVLMEHLLDRTYRAAISREFELSEVVPGLVPHMTWFVTKHFAPFPATPEVALKKFRTGLSAESATRLSPLFYDMKRAELGDPGHMKATWTARFRSSTSPPGWGGLLHETATQIATLQRA
jgi:hypothetical protein